VSVFRPTHPLERHQCDNVVTPNNPGETPTMEFCRTNRWRRGESVAAPGRQVCASPPYRVAEPSRLGTCGRPGSAKLRVALIWLR